MRRTGAVWETGAGGGFPYGMAPSLDAPSKRTHSAPQIAHHARPAQVPTLRQRYGPPPRQNRPTRWPWVLGLLKRNRRRSAAASGKVSSLPTSSACGG
jgi:hypothetical protein